MSITLAFFLALEIGTKVEGERNQKGDKWARPSPAVDRRAKTEERGEEGKHVMNGVGDGVGDVYGSSPN